MGRHLTDRESTRTRRTPAERAKSYEPEPDGVSAMRGILYALVATGLLWLVIIVLAIVFTR